MKPFKPVYSYVDIYVTTNNGRQLQGILVFEDRESEGLNELEYDYDSKTETLTFHGFDTRDFENLDELRSDMNQLLYNRRQDSIRLDDRMWHWIEGLAYTIGHYARRAGHHDQS